MNDLDHFLRRRGQAHKFEERLSHKTWFRGLCTGQALVRVAGGQEDLEVEDLDEDSVVSCLLLHVLLPAKGPLSLAPSVARFRARQ